MKSFILIAALLTFCSVPVYGFVCGDANSDQDINVGDAVYVINYIFRGGPAPAPLEAGDVNLDLAVNIGDAVYIINFIFKGGPVPCPDASGEVTGVDGCKDTSNPGASQFLECVEYSYQQGTLFLTHLNGEFNCCIESIQAVISVDETTIMISEIEYYGDGTPCYCLCPFDVDFEIWSLSVGQYTIHIELEGLSAPPPIEFTVDLAQQPSGIYCVE